MKRFHPYVAIVIMSYVINMICQGYIVNLFYCLFKYTYILKTKLNCFLKRMPGYANYWQIFSNTLRNSGEPYQYTVISLVLDKCMHKTTQSIKSCGQKPKHH